MKHNIKVVSSNEWLHLVNKEADPDFNKKELNFIKLGDAYLVHVISGVGNIVSTCFNKSDATDEEIDSFLDKAAEDVEKLYLEKKNQMSLYQGFLSAPINPTGLIM